MKKNISRRKFLKKTSLTSAAAAAGIYANKTKTYGSPQKCNTSSSFGTIKESPRETPVVADVDICVIGGSCTGVFAAVAAARLGARVAIIENNGFFGGVATASLVNIWHSPFNTSGKKQIIAGLTIEIIEKLKKSRALHTTNTPSTYYRLNTYELMIELDKLITENKVRPFLHSLFVAPALKDGNLDAIIMENKSGRQAVKASYFIDATGDGDLIHRMGLPTYKRNYIQPPTMCAIIRGLKKLKKENSEFSLNDAVFNPKNPNALKKGFLWSAEIPGAADETMVSGTRVFGADCSDAAQLTNAEIEGRRQVRAICNTLRSYMNDKKSPLVSLPAKIGIRETRHAKCLHTLTQEELLNGVRFPDAIANGTYPVDIHQSESEGIIFRYLDGTERLAGANGVVRKGRWREEQAENPTFYQIPYRSLVPKGAKNVLAAGRIIDAAEGAFGAVRVMVNCNQTGEAIGTAAYLALNENKPVAAINTDKLRETLSKNGAVII